MDLMRRCAFLLALVALAIAEPRAQRRESNLGTYPVPDVVGMSGDEPFSAVATVVEHETYDVRGILFFELKFKGESITVSADADTAFAKALHAHHHRKARITIASAELQEIAR